MTYNVFGGTLNLTQ